MPEVLSAHGGRDVGATGLCKAWAEGDNQEWGKGESGYELWIPSLSNVGYILGISAWSWIQCTTKYARGCAKHKQRCV